MSLVIAINLLREKVRNSTDVLGYLEKNKKKIKGDHDLNEQQYQSLLVRLKREAENKLIGKAEEKKPKTKKAPATKKKAKK